jgi:hypothetical protein
MLRIPHCLDSRLIDGGKVVSPTHQPHFTPRKHYYFNISGTHFCQRLSKLQSLVRPEELGTSVFTRVTDGGTEGFSQDVPARKQENCAVGLLALSSTISNRLLGSNF